MSHLLETMNPASADSVKAATAPGVGAMVVFIPRPGEQRMGRNEFAATVMFKHDDLTLDLLVIFGADDVGERLRVRYWHEDEPYHCWKHVEGAEPEQFEPSRLNKMRQDVDDLTTKVDELRQDIFGGYNKPAKALIEFLVEFEGKLREFGKSLRK